MIGIRGLAEAFYGVYYTFPERNDLIRFLAAHGFNYYLYGPKNDRQHRARWREAYPAKIMSKFADTVQLAQHLGITFCYSLGPGVSMCYASSSDFTAITTKFSAFHDIGVRAFSLLLDDITPDFVHEQDREHYLSYAEAHADLCNRVYSWLQALDPACTLSMCPTDYHGTEPFSPYLRELGAKLHPAIDIFYTGPEICSPTISLSTVEAFARAVGRTPMIWDNYPVNDLAMQPELHIGPITGRDPLLGNGVHGLLINPMNLTEATKIPLLTWAAYLNDPLNYDAEVAWKDALRTVGGEESADALSCLLENSRTSFLGRPQEHQFTTLTQKVLDSLEGGEAVTGNPAVAELGAALTALDEACYHLKNRMDNLALRNNLLPWIEAAELWLWGARYAIQVLEAIEQGQPYQHLCSQMDENFDAAQRHPKRSEVSIVEALHRVVASHLPQRLRS
jgi:hyaluronoglucosaminidase